MLIAGDWTGLDGGSLDGYYRNAAWSEVRSDGRLAQYAMLRYLKMVAVGTLEF